MSKVIPMVFIISFWVVLPLVFSLGQVPGYTEIIDEFRDLDTVEQPSFLTYVSVALDITVYFFQTMFIWVQGIPPIFNVILWILRLVSAFIIIMVLRGS